MFHLYQSNSLETLADALLAQLGAHPPRHPLQPVEVVVGSPAVGDWLARRAADAYGIAANLEFPLPAVFSWRLLRDAYPELPLGSGFQRDVLVWRIFEWLQRAAAAGEAAPELVPLARYLYAPTTAAPGDRTWQLASRLAVLFDDYIIFRADWLRAWEAGRLLRLGDDERWQAMLWRHLHATAAEPDWAALVERWVQAPPAGTGQRAPVWWFAVAGLSPRYLDWLEALGRDGDVHCFQLNPCREWWVDLASPRQLARLPETDDPGAVHLEAGHPLLTSWGHSARAAVDRLADIGGLSADLYFEDPADTRLALLKNTILDSQLPEDVSWAAREGDTSLEIHSCHSPLREAEVLYDALLDRLARDPSLTPDDIRVYVVDLPGYAPAIAAAFAQRDGDTRPALPARVLLPAPEDPLVEAWLEWLRLPESRWPASTVLGWLELPAIARGAGLEAEAVKAVKAWVDSAGIRWGRDDDQQATLGLPRDPIRTWREGIDRLLLGAALPQAVAGGASGRFASLLPCDPVEGSRLQMLGALAQWFDQLSAFVDALAGEHPVGEWCDWLQGNLLRLMVPADEDEREAVERIHRALRALAEQAERAGLAQAVPFGALRRALIAELERTPARPLGGGGVVFAPLAPHQVVPARVVAVLGLADGAFPRAQSPSGFDLIARYPRRGDRVARSEDRFALFETLLAAQDAWLLSYVGQDLQTGEAQPPAVVLAELIDVLKGYEGDVAVAALRHRHARHPFDPAYFGSGGRTPLPRSYNAAWLPAAQALQTAGHGVTAGPPPLIGAPLVLPAPSEEDIELGDLVEFWSSPARRLLRHTLGLELPRGAALLEDREPFALDRLQQAEFSDRLLAGESLPAWRDRLRGDGSLPSGNVGEVWLEDTEARATAVLARLPEEASPLVLPPFRLETPAGVLVGTVAGRADGRLVVASHEPWASEWIGLWIQHLAWCYAAPAGVGRETRRVAPEQTWIIGAVDAGEAAARLSELVALYIEGQLRPLPFFPKSSLAYAEAWANPKLEDDARHARGMADASRAWLDDNGGRSRPESDKSEYRLLYRGNNPLDAEFARLAAQVLTPLLAVRRKEGGRNAA